MSTTRAALPPVRHLVRARDLADARYTEPLTVDDLAAAACLSRAHFSRAYGMAPLQYRASFPSAASLAMIPLCVLKAYGRPVNSTIGEDAG